MGFEIVGTLLRATARDGSTLATTDRARPVPTTEILGRNTLRPYHLTS